MKDDKRLIEDYLPIEAISAEASREKSVRKGHISTLHLWWARRPLVACRAAVYGALVPADRFVPANGSAAKKKSLGRANAAKFVTSLCKYPGDPKVIAEAQRHILEAHAERLTAEMGQPVTVADIEAGRAPRPKVLDMFAGGGAIPLEALRLGCQAYALDLNPVAHIIQLCTLVYPQKYGKPDPTARGMTGPKNDKNETTWGGLAKEVRYWGEWVLKKVKAEIGDLYPLIPDPAYKESKSSGGTGRRPVQESLFTTRRNLPHWEMGGSTYFLTYRCASGITLDESDRDIVIDNWRHWHGKRYLLHCAVVMPDHVHVLITPLKNGPDTWHPLEEILHTNKGFTAQQINKRHQRRGSVWQDERYDRIMRDDEEFQEKWNYIAYNSVKAGLVCEPQEYRWYYQNPSAWEEQGTGQRPVPPETGMEDSDGGTGRWPVQEVPPGYLVPVAYLWTRTVTCKNPTCTATVPLLRQTWLCKKKDRYVALKVSAPKGEKRVRFEVVESKTEKGLGFDPAGFSKAGNATCPFCNTVAENDYVKAEGKAGRIGTQPMAVVCTRPGARGKVYLSVEQAAGLLEKACTGQRPVPPEDELQRRIAALCQRTELTVPDEPMPKPGTLGFRVQPYGIKTWGELFTPRQMLSLLTFAAAVREAHAAMASMDGERAKATTSMLACYVDRAADHWSSLCAWNPSGEKLQHTFGRQALPMVWDYSEANPWGESVGDWISFIENAENGIWAGTSSGSTPCTVARGSAMAQPWPDGTLDAVITDPPYYDNVPYADISDYFYVWLRRTVGTLYPEHLTGQGTPKKQEAVADATRHGGDKKKAVAAYESMMAQSLNEAFRVLKPAGTLAVVYAHKTTLGWSTLVDACRHSGFTVTEAWPLDTEMKTRLRGMESAALASSIFLVGRKRDDVQVGQAAGLSSPGQRPGPPGTGSYETDVQPELETIVRERVETLWDQGISGADLVIACVGAGLRAFTRFARVEYANGDEVPAERFLTEVETVVLDSILARLSKEVTVEVGQAAGLSKPTHRPAAGATKVGVSLAGVDPATRFYTLWRYTYRAAELDAGEAIIFANGTHVELDGPSGMSSGADALVEKKKGKYRLRDFTERGDDDDLGQPTDEGQAAPLVDVLHRVLWLMEHRPRELASFLRGPGGPPGPLEQLRLVAQALAGPALKGGEMADVSPTAEMAALAKLTSNWRSVIEDNATTVEERADQRRGQKKLFE